MDKNCAGCIYESPVSICKKNQDGNCPCGACLVKMMCKDPCENWGLWYVIEHAKKQRRDGWI